MLVLVAIACVTIFVVIRNSTVARQTAGLQEIMDRAMARFDGYFRNMDNLALQVFSDPEIRSLLAEANADETTANFFTEHSEQRRRLFARLLTINGPLSNAMRLSVFGLRGDHVDYGVLTVLDHLVSSRIDRTPWVGDVYEASGSRLIVGPRADEWSLGDRFSIVSVARALRYEGTVFGFVQVDQPFSDVVDIVSVRDPAVSVVLVDGLGQALHQTHPDGFGDEHAVAYARLVTEKGFVPTVARSPFSGDRELVVGARSTMSGWTYILSIRYAAVVALSRRVIVIVAGVSVLVAMLLLQADYLVSRSISQPIRELSDRLRSVRAENPQIEFPAFRANDELEYLKDSVEAMFAQLTESMRDLVEAQRSELNAHYRALQSQINPHFLYNLFAVMGSIAREEKSDRLVRICREASSMLRYISRSEAGLVSIGDEIAYAANYVHLMKERFEEGLDVVFDVDDRIGDALVPKLFLQPIIENCYAHGFSGVAPPWRVRVVGTVETIVGGASYWVIRVTDNGVGFSAPYNEMEAIGAAAPDLPERVDSEGGVGLRNIYERLRIHYRQNMILSWRNVEQNDVVVGAVVTIGGPIGDPS